MKLDLVRYLHAACFSPVHSTWLKAIRNNNFTTWPGLTKSLVEQYLPVSQATVQGHLHKERQNLQSTRVKEESQSQKTQEHDDDNIFPPSPTPNVKKNQVAYILINKKEITTAYQDLTGRFPFKSSRGNEYVLIGYHHDANCILAHPVWDRKTSTLTKAWEQLHCTFAKAGVAPDVWVLNNKVS